MFGKRPRIYAKVDTHNTRTHMNDMTFTHVLDDPEFFEQPGVDDEVHDEKFETELDDEKS